MLLLILTCSLNSQIIDTDTSDVVIRKTKKETPQEFNISDVVIKMDKEKTKHVMRVDLDIPAPTTLKLNVSDSSGAVIMYLINDQSFKAGVYRVKWEMIRCISVTNEECYSPGKYFCAFETDQFVYQKDFYIK
jgi:hypothetical protein